MATTKKTTAKKAPAKKAPAKKTTTTKKSTAKVVKSKLKDELELPTTAVVAPASKESGLIFKNKTYDILKLIAQIILPAIATLWIAVSTIWNLPLADQIEQTIAAIIVFLDTLLGLTLAKASADYHKGDA